MRNSMACLTLSAALFGVPTLASADPLTLNGLSIFGFDVEGEFFRFAGNSFDLQTSVQVDESGNFFHIPITFEGFGCFPPCRPGDVIGGPIHTDGEVDLGKGHGVINGAEFSSLAFRGSLGFRRESIVFPNTSDSFVRLATPFLFDSVFRAFADDVEVFSHALRGAGTEFEGFFRNEPEDTFSPAEGQITFVFEPETAPTPEPSTMLLVGAGALALARRRAQRARSS